MRVELALRLLELLDLADDVLALPLPWGADTTCPAPDGPRRSWRSSGNGRQLTTYFKRSFAWRNALHAYRAMPYATVRLFDGDDQGLSFDRRATAMAPGPATVYDARLEGPLPLRVGGEAEAGSARPLSSPRLDHWGARGDTASRSSSWTASCREPRSGTP